MNKKQKNAHNKGISIAIGLVMSSVDSHLEYCYGPTYHNGETNLFHQKCIQDYLIIAVELAKHYRR